MSNKALLSRHFCWFLKSAIVASPMFLGTLFLGSDPTAAAFSLSTLGTNRLALANSGSAGWAFQEQEVDAELERERMIVDRFLTLLLKKPRLGTAFDRVYGFHIANGSIDSFVEELSDKAEADTDGQIYMVVGMVQMRRGNDLLAADAFRKAEELIPEEPLVSYYLGKTLVSLGEVDAAAEAMNRAIAAKPPRLDLLTIFKDLGRIYQRTGNVDEALNTWKRLEEQFPDDLQVQEEIASVLAEEGAYEEALSRFQDLASKQKDPYRRIEMAIRAAQMQARVGNQKEAQSAFEAQLAQVNPDSWLHQEIRRQIEDLYWSSNDIDGLIDYYQSWIEGHPDDVKAMVRVARILAIQKQLPEAEKWFQRAIEKAPSDHELRMQWVDTLATEYRFGEAAKAMAEVVKLQPDNLDYLIRWGELVFNDQDLKPEQRVKQAREIWGRLLEKRADDPVTTIQVADLLRGIEAKEDAIGLYNKAIDLAPNDPQYREYLGEYQHRLGRKDEALATWAKIAEGEREDRDNLVRLSEVYGTFNYDQLALETIAKACERRPEFGHRARYAELLRESQKYEEALAQLDLAESLATDPDLRSLLLTERIKVFQDSGTLEDRIAEAEKKVADEAEDAEAWQWLAMLRSADRKMQLACEAIEKSLELKPEEVSYWETAADLFERAGRFGDAVRAYEKLATLDRQYLTNYLTQIATLQMRVGNTEAALKAGEDLLAAAPNNSDSYRFYSDLCFQAGESERGLDALRRNVRNNPNDRDALIYLAQTLANEFQTDESIELYWRAFDSAKNVDEQIQNIESMTELYLRSNRMTLLLDRLETLAREKSQPRVGILWTSAVHQAAGDLGTAREQLEQLARQGSRDTDLLEQLVKLSTAEYDNEAAVDYQTQLVNASPTRENEYRLANLLLQNGDLERAQQIWVRLANRSDSGSVIKTLGTLMSRGEFGVAWSLAQQWVEASPRNWELLGQALLIAVREGHHDEARQLAQQILELNVPMTEPSDYMAERIERWEKSKDKNPQMAGAYDLEALARSYNSMSYIRRSLGRERYVSTRFYPFQPNCYADVYRFARWLPLIDPAEDFDSEAYLKEAFEQALSDPDPDDMVDLQAGCVWLAGDGVPLSDDLTELQTTVRDRLVEAGDMYALQQKAQSLVMPSGTDGEKVSDEDLDEALKLYKQIPASQVGALPYYVSNAMFNRDEVSRGLQFMLEATEDEKSVATQYIGNVVNELISKDRKLDGDVTNLLTKLMDRSQTKQTFNVNNGNYYNSNAQLSEAWLKAGEVDTAIAQLKSTLKSQAEYTADLRPSKREQFGSSDRYYVRNSRGSLSQTSIEFPKSSGYFGQESVLELYVLHQTAKGLDSDADEQLLKSLKEWHAAETENPYEDLVYAIAYAAVLKWNGDSATATKVVSEAADNSVAPMYVAIMKAQMLYADGRGKEALPLLQEMRPRSQKMLVDRELAILTLLLEEGDLDEARKSVTKLFALRLDSDTELQLADLIYQLGMKDLGDRMMMRIRRRAGGRQDTLVQLMSRYLQADKKEDAAEVARQVLRRTEPAESRSSRTSSNVQHEQALQTLVKTGDLGGEIERYEKMHERSPKSREISLRLSAMYEAAGRREDAEKLVMESLEKSRDSLTPQQKLKSSVTLYSSGKKEEGIELMLEGLRKQPDLFENSYYDLRPIFQDPVGAEAIVKFVSSKDGKTLQGSYRIGELVNEIQRLNRPELLQPLLESVLSGSNWTQLAQSIRSLQLSQMKLSDEFRKQVADRLTEKGFINSNSIQSYVMYSRSSGGRASGGFLLNLLTILPADKEGSLQLIQDLEEIKKATKNNDVALLQAGLYSKVGQVDEALEVLKPLLEQENKSTNLINCFWVLASEFIYVDKNREAGLGLLERLSNKEISSVDNGNDFEFGPRALMLHAYGSGANSEKALEFAREVLAESEEFKPAENYNQEYEAYQYRNSMVGLASMFVKNGSPLDALYAIDRANQPTVTQLASQFSGGSNTDTLMKQAISKLTGDELVSVLDSLVEKEQEEGRFQFLTETVVSGDSIVDARLQTRLEGLMESISESEAAAETLKEWLGNHPWPEGEWSAESIKLLSHLLTLARAVEDEGREKELNDVLVQWRKHNNQWMDDFGSDDSEAEAGETSEPENDGEVDHAAERVNRTHYLLLYLQLVLEMPKASRPDGFADLLGRDSSFITKSDYEMVFTTLRRKWAQELAATDKEQAEKIMLDILDDLLPKAETIN